MRALISAAVLALTLTACGGGDEEPKESASSEASGVDMEAAVDACRPIVQDSINKATFNEDGERETLDPEAVMRVGDGGSTVTVAPLQQVDFLIQPSVDAGVCMLSELEAPDSVVSTVSQATGLTGQQDAEWEGVNLTYSYNGNVGFAGVFTAAK